MYLGQLLNFSFGKLCYSMLQGYNGDRKFWSANVRVQFSGLKIFASW